MEYRFSPAPRVYTLTPEHGPAVDVQRIGKGQFCTAYRQVSDPSIVWLVVAAHRGDHSKEILSRAYELNNNPHIPVLERMGDMGDNDVYRTQFYARITAAHKQAWKDYRALSVANNKARYESGVQAGNCMGLDWMDKTLELVSGVVSAQLLEALQDIRDTAIDYGQSYTFEFAPRNLGVDSTGQLILLDPIFDLETIEREREAKRRKYERRY